MSHTVLIIEDDTLQATLLEKLVTKMGLAAKIAPSGKAAVEMLSGPDAPIIHVILLDMVMPNMNGLETFRRLARLVPDVPVIFLTATNDAETAAAAMKAGAFDYITKPYDADRLKLTVHNALKLSLMTRRADPVKWNEDAPLRFTDLVGHDTSLERIISIAQRIAPLGTSALITGETGTGKDVLARAIHGESDRREGPFIAVNIAAIPENLIESILFGHEKGAFTGAVQKTLGKFREANGGTIFLDEIGDMPMGAQTRLLRVLQQGEVEPLGAARPVPINVRVISATHVDLLARAKEKTFRLDLYFRLNVLSIDLPPLRQRLQDLPALSQHLIDRFTARENLPARKISAAGVDLLKSYDWPGNIRELENTLRRAVILSDHDPLGPEDLRPFIQGVLSARKAAQAGAKTVSGPDANGSPSLPNGLNLSALSGMISVLDDEDHVRNWCKIERDILLSALHHMGGNVAATCLALGISRPTFYRKLNGGEE